MAVAADSALEQPLRVSEAVGKKLVKLGLQRQVDMLLHLPLRYEDETRITPLADAAGGDAVQVEVQVLTCEVSFRPRRQMVVRAQDATGELILRFFSFYPNQLEALARGRLVRAFGEVRNGFLGLEMVHPRFHVVQPDDPLPGGLTPIYPTTAGVGNGTLRKLAGLALQVRGYTDTVPAALRERWQLPAAEAALAFLHQPPSGTPHAVLQARNHPAWRRIKFD